MISVPIKISVQEVIDFPPDKVQCAEQWCDLLDPAHDDRFKKKRKKKK